jgi:threonine/homoserine/homoserine lactone efflux protein
MAGAFFMVELLLALLRGIGLGFAAGIPFGPVNAAVVDTSMRKCTRTALAIGMGGAFVDFLYSQLAVLGVGRVLKQYPDVSSFLVGGSGVVLVIYGVKTLMAPPLSRDPEGQRTGHQLQGRRLWAGFFAGVLLTLANPAALLSWVVLAGALLSDLTRLQSFLAGVGIFAGVTLWFAGIGWIARVGKLKFGERALLLTKTIGALIVAYGVFLVAQAGKAVWTTHLR